MVSDFKVKQIETEDLNEKDYIWSPIILIFWLFHNPSPLFQLIGLFGIPKFQPELDGFRKAKYFSLLLENRYLSTVVAIFLGEIEAFPFKII